MKSLSQKFCLLCLFIFTNVSGYSQDITGAIDSAFAKFQNRPPLEKLYLHTDKSTFNSGGTIWFKGYLVTATGHAPFAWSKFIYVELFSNSDSLIYRKKIKEKDGVFSGNIKLDSKLSDGEYILRAYSKWMLNAEPDYLFRKIIRISNFQSKLIHSKINYTEGTNGNTNATVAFYTNEGKPLGKTLVECTVQFTKRESETFYRTTDVDGKINFDFNKKDSELKNNFIKVRFENGSKPYENKFTIPLRIETDFDLQFFPEGGELIAGVGTKLAFKAIAEDGYSTEVSGIIVDNNKDTILTFKSQYLGAGSVYFIPEEGKKYLAIANNPKGFTKTFPLPEPATNGASLALAQRNDVLHLSIRANGDSLQKPYNILVHSCETRLFNQAVDRLNYTIPTQNLPEGIVNFVLVDEKMHPVSSRMVFIKKKKAVNVTVKPDKEYYKRRETVSLSVLLEQNDTISRTGNFSISVTDDQVVEIDSLADNIYTNLLLTSDLKGNIENPAFYFLNDMDSTNYYLDLLMLTQGWQRFKIKDVLQNKLSNPTHFLEMGQTISGDYQKRLLHKKTETEITALSIKPLISVSTQASTDGSFIFNKLDFPDSTVFTIQSQKYTNIKQEPAGIITLDTDTFPPILLPHHTKINQDKIDQSLLENSKERMYFEGEGRVIHLEEFIVTGTDRRKNYTLEYGLSSDIMDEDDIAKKFPISRSADFIVKTLSGVRQVGENILIRGNTVPAEIMIDKMMAELNDLTLLMSEDIESIIVIKGPGAAIYSQNGGIGGVIMINIKEGGSFKYQPMGVTKYMPLGYQKDVEFYVPKYEVDSILQAKKPDMRSTVYWDPKIKIDSTGTTTINFYTADPNTTYTYILEGVSNLGEICRYIGKLNRSEK